MVSLYLYTTKCTLQRCFILDLSAIVTVSQRGLTMYYCEQRHFEPCSVYSSDEASFDGHSSHISHGHRHNHRLLTVSLFGDRPRVRRLRLGFLHLYPEVLDLTLRYVSKRGGNCVLGVC